MINNDVGGLDLADIERSILTPDQSAGQELLSPGAESGSFEEISRVAATLYIEMKRCIKVRNLKAFREAVTVCKEILKRNDLHGSTHSRNINNNILVRLASLKNELGENLLHEAGV